MPRKYKYSTKSADGKIRVAWRLDPLVIAAVKIEAAANGLNSAAETVERLLRTSLRLRLSQIAEERFVPIKRPEV